MDSSLPNPPFIDVEGVQNLRDLGGHLCNTSNPFTARRSIRRGYFYRGAQLTQISESGSRTLKEKYNVHHVFDLRSEAELKQVAMRFPDLSPEIAGVIVHKVPVFEAEDNSPIAFARKHALYVGDDSPFFSENEDMASASKSRVYSPGYVLAYIDIAEKAALAGSFRTIMRYIILHPTEPLIVHCTAGKDRTGVFTSLLLKLCGVSDEHIAWDYALTKKGMGRWRDYLIKRIMEGAGDSNLPEAKSTLTKEAAEKIFGSRTEDMLAFLKFGVQDKFGGARAYFVKQCNMEESELDEIVSILVVEAEPYLTVT